MSARNVFLTRQSTCNLGHTITYTYLCSITNISFSNADLHITIYKRIKYCTQITHPFSMYMCTLLISRFILKPEKVGYDVCKVEWDFILISGLYFVLCKVERWYMVKFCIGTYYIWSINIINFSKNVYYSLYLQYNVWMLNFQAKNVHIHAWQTGILFSL